MTTPQLYCPELLSALADGELVMDIDDAGLQGVFQSNTLHSDWNNYQAIGHALKEGADASLILGADLAFLHRFNERLADDKILPQGHFFTKSEATALPLQTAANDAVFRWKLVAGFASLAAALVVTWSFIGSPNVLTDAQFVQNRTASQVVMASPEGVILRDARLEELMAAHKQLGGSSLQAPSGFLRNAGFENAQSTRR